MKYILTLVSIVVVGIVMLAIIIPLENQLSDCRFECNHLQTKVYMLREFSDYVEILEQLPPLVVAELKVANEIIKRRRYKEFERYEQPLLTEKERKK